MLRIILCTFSLALLLPAGINAGEFGHWGDREWHEMKSLPEDLYQQFLTMPKTNVGHLDIILPREGTVVATVDIRDDIAVIFFRGVPGGRGFANSAEDMYFYRFYILEIRWHDKKENKWRVWWNRDKLIQSLLTRPELYPMATDAPF